MAHIRWTPYIISLKCHYNQPVLTILGFLVFSITGTGWVCSYMDGPGVHQIVISFQLQFQFIYYCTLKWDFTFWNAKQEHSPTSYYIPVVILGITPTTILNGPFKVYLRVLSSIWGISSHPKKYILTGFKQIRDFRTGFTLRCKW